MTKFFAAMLNAVHLPSEVIFRSGHAYRDAEGFSE